MFLADTIPQHRWFLQQDYPEPASLTDATLYTFKQPMTVHEVESAYAQLVSRHDVLWGSLATPAYVERTDSDVRVLAHHRVSKTLSREETGTIFEELSQQINVTTGPLLAAALLVHQGTATGMALVIHHLVMDAVSISILEHELDSLLAGVELPAAPSFKEWAGFLANHQPSIAETDRLYWERHTGSGRDTYWRPFSERLKQTVQLSGEDLEDFRLACRKQRAFPGEVLFGIIEHAVRTSEAIPYEAGTSDVLFVGRTVGAYRPSLAGAVGWYATRAPVPVALSRKVSDTVQSAIQGIRRTPNSGWGHELLASPLAPDARPYASNRALSYNYVTNRVQDFKRITSIETIGLPPKASFRVSPWLAINAEDLGVALEVHFVTASSITGEDQLRAIAEDVRRLVRDLHN